jgi:hypothetical protein
VDGAYTGKCCACIAWAYQHSDLSEREGERMTGWCRVWSQDTNQSFGCDSFYSKAKQQADYLASLKSK